MALGEDLRREDTLRILRHRAHDDVTILMLCSPAAVQGSLQVSVHGIAEERSSIRRSERRTESTSGNGSTIVSQCQ
jgi:hypothetical protein